MYCVQNHLFYYANEYKGRVYLLYLLIVNNTEGASML